MFLDQRDHSLSALIEMGFDGYAVGGLSVGEPKNEMFKVMRHIAPKFWRDMAHYLKHFVFRLPNRQTTNRIAIETHFDQSTQAVVSLIQKHRALYNTEKC